MLPVQGLQLWLWTLVASSPQVRNRARHTNMTAVYRPQRGFDSLSVLCFLTLAAGCHFPTGPKILWYLQPSSSSVVAGEKQRSNQKARETVGVNIRVELLLFLIGPRSSR